MKRFIPIIFLSTFFACNNCGLQDKIVTSSTDAIVTQLQCKNAAAVKASVTTMVSKLGLCSASAKASLDVCPIAAQIIVAGMSSQIPAEWECSAENASAGLEKAITSACESQLNKK